MKIYGLARFTYVVSMFWSKGEGFCYFYISFIRIILRVTSYALSLTVYFILHFLISYDVAFPDAFSSTFRIKPLMHRTFNFACTRYKIVTSLWTVCCAVHGYGTVRILVAWASIRFTTQAYLNSVGAWCFIILSFFCGCLRHSESNMYYSTRSAMHGLFVPHFAAPTSYPTSII